MTCRIRRPCKALVRPAPPMARRCSVVCGWHCRSAAGYTPCRMDGGTEKDCTSKHSDDKIIQPPRSRARGLGVCGLWFRGQNDTHTHGQYHIATGRACTGTNTRSLAHAPARGSPLALSLSRSPFCVVCLSVCVYGQSVSVSCLSSKL